MGIGPGYWAAFADGVFVGLGPIAGVTQASGLTAILQGDNSGLTVFATYYLAGDRTPGVVLPFPTVLDNEVPLTLRIHGPTDADYIQATIDDVGKWLNFEFQQLGWNLHIGGNVTREGADFPVAESQVAVDALTFSFVGRGQAQPVAEATKDVWADLSERGADVGIIGDQFGGGEGAQERIEARIRYDSDLAIVTKFVDDLGRRWLATSTRTEGNRRWLVIEGQRLVAGIDLPELGAGA